MTFHMPLPENPHALALNIWTDHLGLDVIAACEATCLKAYVLHGATAEDLPCLVLSARDYNFAASILTWDPGFDASVTHAPLTLHGPLGVVPVISGPEAAGPSRLVCTRDPGLEPFE